MLINSSQLEQPLSGSFTGSFSGSFQGNVIGYTSTSSFNAFTASYRTDSSSFDVRINNVFQSESKYLLTSSYYIDSSSFLLQIRNVFTSESNYLLTASYYSDSASFNDRINNINTSSYGITPITVVAATTSSLSGYIYNNGSSGIGATLTSVLNFVFPSVDGAVLSLNDRVLVKNQTSSLQNGPYSLSQTGSSTAPVILTRTSDANETAEFDPQIVIPVTGSINKGLLFGQQTETPVMGTDDIVYESISGSNYYITQKVSGIQRVNQIPLYTANPKELSKGSAQFKYVPGTRTFTIAGLSYVWPNASGSGTTTIQNTNGVLSWVVTGSGGSVSFDTSSFVTTASYNIDSASFDDRIRNFTSSATGSLQDLQSVTNIGNTTTASIEADAFLKTNDPDGYVFGLDANGRISTKGIYVRSGSIKTFLTNEVTTSNHTIYLPDATAVLVASVNGIFADNSGSITIPTGSTGQSIDTASFVTTGSNRFFGDEVITGSVYVSGSLYVTGSVTAQSFTGSLLGTSSYASQALSASYAVSSSASVSASWAFSSSYAYTASYAPYYTLTSSFNTLSSSINNDSASFNSRISNDSSSLFSLSSSYNTFTSSYYAASTSFDLRITNTSSSIYLLSGSVSASLALKEDVSNKSTTTTLGTSNTLYPSQNAVKTYVDNNSSGNKLYSYYNLF